jgi:Hint domain-containing protein
MAVSLDLDSNPNNGVNDTSSFTEGGKPITLFKTATLDTFGKNSDHVDKITISLGGAAQDGESLGADLSGMNGFHQSFDPSTGVLTISKGNGADAKWEDILQSVTYSNTNDDPVASRSIVVTATDRSPSNNAAAATERNQPVETATATDTLTITQVNDAPVNTVPGAQVDNIALPGDVVFSAGNGNQISVADADNETLSVTLAVSNGSLTLNGTAGLTFESGANGEGAMRITGSISDINAALNGLAYHTDSTDTTAGDVNDVLTITTNDGSALDSDNINIDVICFMPGTSIAVPGGEAKVETLRPGDLITTTAGEAKTVRWIGRQTVSRVFADPLRVLPIRIKADALGENTPCRDLLISPDHAILVDGVLVQAGALVNGSSIVRETEVPQVFTYYHVELDDHSLVLAENVAAETFIDNVDRLGFDNWAEHEALYPDGKPIEEMIYPRANSFRQVPHATRMHLATRGEAFYGGAAAAAA